MNFESCGPGNGAIGAIGAGAMGDHHSNNAVDLSGTGYKRGRVTGFLGTGKTCDDRSIRCGGVDHQVHNSRLRSVTKRIGSSNRNLVLPIGQYGHGG